MQWIGTPTYDIQRPTGRCAITGQPLDPGQQYMAVLIEADNQSSHESVAGGVTAETSNTPDGHPAIGLRRIDISLHAWDQGHRPDRLFCHWRSTVPQPNEKKKTFVDDSVLMDLIHRLDRSDQPERLSFRFVLALLLMRKKLLRYDTCEKRTDENGCTLEWWRMTPKGGDESIDVLNPQLNDEQIQQVTAQLGQILESDI